MARRSLGEQLDAYALALCEAMTKEPVAYLNRALLLSIANAACSVRREAATLEKGPEFSADNAVGRRLREAVEQYRQEADLIAGWVKRHCESVGLSYEDLPNV